MARYSKIFFVFIILVLSLWLIPWFYHFMTAQPIRNLSLYTAASSMILPVSTTVKTKGYNTKTGTDIFIPIVSSTAYCLSFITISSLPTAACRTA